MFLLLAAPVWADVQDDLEDAFMAHRRGEYEQAINLYTKVTKAPKLAQTQIAVAFLLRGEVFADKGDYAQAISDFTRSLKLRPNYAQAFYARGLAYEKKGRLAKAYKDVKKAQYLSPAKEVYKQKLVVLEDRIRARKERPAQ
ncbi:MAG: tetratricopeptide repeat protein [Thermodesulfobacteriota bacterium]|nr:tetratricopeptide repeat protein [Thermodesulfobacteriota bacterium]